MNQIIATNSVYKILSRREIQVLLLIINGNTDKDIAGKLSISYNTARTHHQNILAKTGQHSISGLIYFALKNGMSESNETVVYTRTA